MDTRVVLHFTPQKMDELDGMMGDLCLVTRKQLFTDALLLLIWAAGEARNGRQIVSINKSTGTYKSVKLKALDTIRERAIS